MTKLPEPDRMRNRELLAQRLEWPAEALGECIAIGEDFPRWMVYWQKGDLPAAPRRGYVARHGRLEVFGETPEELRAALAAADATLDPPTWPPPWSGPISEPR